MIKQLPFTLLFLISLQTFTQENRNFLYASLKDEIGFIANAHIVNVNTNQGTFSNENGQFRILAKSGDSLQISFVGYETKKVKLSHKHFGIQKTVFNLQKITIELDEVEIKNHDLLGELAVDIKQTPKDLHGEKAKKAIDFSKENFDQPLIMPIDEIERGKAPNMRKETDPTAKFAGVGGAISTGGIDGYAEEKRRIRKTIRFKEGFPKMLLSNFGEQFFFDELKIPKEKYLHFLEYCNPLGIEKLYKQGNVLKVIDILRKESVSYLKIIHKKE